ncbi:protein ALP1-like [Sorghum bicolor]|uniref:protein ALP1-like n=1 Tax=Sorghum bicolor TaxID=4558 RepID=UPI000B424CB4|nr:protein ALP1-like [Sorghum bicolor]|eukprot:XP_021321676.1 protein ALP1-like [Sorghum bicolor]
MVVVDFDLKFTYVLAGWEGFAHDALILSDAIERQDGFTMPQGKYYLVDAGYVCRNGFLPPYRGVRYHLSEFGSNMPTNAQELFNLRHSSLRVTMERAIGALKNRFRILDNKPFHKYKTQVKLVIDCCFIHNWILGFGTDEHVPSEVGFTGTLPDPHDTDSQEQDFVLMAAKRDGICNAMWEGRGTHRI